MRGSCGIPETKLLINVEAVPYWSNGDLVLHLREFRLVNVPSFRLRNLLSAGRFSPRGPFGHCEPFTYGILLKGGASAFRGADKVPSNGTLCTLPANIVAGRSDLYPRECYFFTPRATRPPWDVDAWTRAHVTGETSTGFPA
jgi:hypothetical protein